MKLLVFIAVLKLVTCGYLPPPDGYYDNRTPTCACDEAQISTLAEKISQLELNLETQRSRSDSLEKRLTHHERNKRQAVYGPVAFTAYLSHWEQDLAIGQPVVFDTALTNEGGFYSTSTGKFTVPLDGLYIFSFMIETKHAVDTAVRLVVDGVNMLDAVVEPRHTGQNLQGGNVGIFKLHKGATVWVENYNREHQTLEGQDSYRFNTFSGALLSEVEDFVSTVG
ncbi:complement C1q tumor necrosis factor-related protein 3-like [Mercenaria mercenaria]|uniref:complement C1q tumor necrosis factor-related protein 3-like n=1 Tax=Mercenaria mercenaria TaxID=6596 RepID=UPI00234E3A36|nr:complement C1q tumor necrosis factor-related protein 3-like [Mercenaria mercenaria]